MLLVRDYVGVKAWSAEAQQAMEDACRDAARTLEDLADIINVTLEQLVRQRFELPAFSVLHRAAQHARSTVNREYQLSVSDRLSMVARKQLDMLLSRAEDESKSPWHRLKSEPKQPSAQNNRDFLGHLDWLRELAISGDTFRGIPDVKVKQFAAEARSRAGREKHVRFITEMGDRGILLCPGKLAAEQRVANPAPLANLGQVLQGGNEFGEHHGLRRTRR
jgi:hypothetical protein